MKSYTTQHRRPPVVDHIRHRTFASGTRSRYHRLRVVSAMGSPAGSYLIGSYRIFSKPNAVLIRMDVDAKDISSLLLLRSRPLRTQHASLAPAWPLPTRRR
jgi:hypothetical protein